ncbi:MAG TPA: ABC transporter ATP-binding protein [Kiloniellaceae bacterium]|nr:ABC transporter ATP-binding protein [Kiloniellaceae bacterium]
MQPPPEVTLQGARLDYGGKTVFRDLDLVLAPGSWTGLLGESGVGKSSLLRYLAGCAHNAAQVGRLTCSDGLPLGGRIAYMAQQDLLLPWLSVLQNVTLGRRLRDGSHRRPEVLAKARALLAAVGLSERAGDLPARLSGGMRQRAALARTLMEDRPVVLMDEPFSALDAITRVRLQDLASELLAGRSVLLVTHDPMEALRLCDRVLVLAGQPARLVSELTVEGRAPRATDNPAILAQQGALLTRLAEGQVAA